MRQFLAQSNQGNHSGINRKWTVSEVFGNNNPLINIALNVSDNHLWYDEAIIRNDYPELLDNNGNLPKWFEGEGVYDSSYNLEVTPTMDAYEHDLVYYYLINEDKIENYDHENYSTLFNKLQEAIGE